MTNWLVVKLTIRRTQPTLGFGAVTNWLVVKPRDGLRLQRSKFWSSDKLTGSQTSSYSAWSIRKFWSSDKLTGSQTVRSEASAGYQFWSSDKLTGSQTPLYKHAVAGRFWSSDKLTGSQTLFIVCRWNISFGAVTNWLVVKQSCEVITSFTSFGAVTNWLVVKLHYRL